MKSNINTSKNIKSRALEYLSKRREKIGNEPLKYLEQSIHNISRHRIQRMLASQLSNEQNMSLNALIKEREEILEYLQQNPGILKTSEA